MERKGAVLTAFLAAFALSAAATTVENFGTDAFVQTELEKHLSLALGENWRDSGALKLVLGECAPGEGAFAAHTSYAKRVGDAVYFWGDDRKGRHGTLFAVYGFLEEVLGVRWVRPGDDGIVCLRRSSLDMPAGWQWTYCPLFDAGYIRCGKFSPSMHSRDKYLPLAMRLSDEEIRREVEDRRVWLLRHREQTRDRPQIGHAFEDWHRRFQADHPEYLALNEKGERGVPPGSRKSPRYMKLCISNSNVVEQVVADWVTKGKPRYLNICPNDGHNYCRCHACCALDNPLTPDEPFSMHKTDRYVDFWNRIAAKVVALRPDVRICTYAYDDYRHPPRKRMIAYPENMVIGMVPSQEEDNGAVLAGWKRAGMRRFMLRPNYHCYYGNLPRGYERAYFENFKLNFRAGMIACDYSASFRSGILDFEIYVIARLISNPELGFDTVENEFLSQYGAAEGVMREYYARIRARGERELFAARRKPQAEREYVPDDSALVATVLAANSVEDLEGDLGLIRKAIALPGLSAVERRRVERQVVVAENALRTRKFHLARDTKSAEEFSTLALDLIAYRVSKAHLFPDPFAGYAFRNYPWEVRWWRAARSAVKEVYPEMELND